MIWHKTTRFELILIAGLLMLPAETSGQSGASPPEVDAATVLRPGDVLRVTVWRREDLSGEFQIDAGGRLLHPILNDVAVVGVPLAAVEKRLAELLQQFEGSSPFVIQPLVRVVITGEIQQPQVYQLPAPTTLTEAIALAGGPTERGTLNRVDLVRAGRSTRLDLTDPASPSMMQALQSGDQIVIGRRRPNILREYIAPAASIVAAAAAITNLFR